MDEIENFFYKLIKDNEKEMVEVLKKTLLKETCESCYEILVSKAMENQEITAEELYVDVLVKLEKYAT